jgi:hypothetical protein
MGSDGPILGDLLRIVTTILHLTYIEYTIQLFVLI